MIEQLLDTEGYAIIRDAIRHDDLTDLADACEQYAYGDLLSYPHFHKFVLNKTLLRCLEHVLGCTPIYFGDSGALLGPRLRGLHRDLKSEDSLRSPEKLIRAGLYLRPTGVTSGGLKVIPKSHKENPTIFRRGFLSKNLYPSNGDIIIWDARLLHSGSAYCFTEYGLSLHPRIEDLISPVKKNKLHERAVLLSTYAQPGDLYAAYKHERTNEHMQEHWQKSFQWSTSTMEIVNRSNVIIDDSLFQGVF